MILTRQPFDLPLEGLEDVPSRRGYVVGEPWREAVNMRAPEPHRLNHISLTAFDSYRVTCLLPSFLFSLDYLAELHVHFLGFVSVGFLV